MSSISKIIHGDCLEVLKTLESDSVDSLVTDPPAGISFMGKDWDDNKGGRDQWIAWLTDVMRECLRVMKPGAHGLVWAIPRTSHWTATAIENAGFEVRDVVTHLFGSGFPKSLDISKAIDKMNGDERPIVGTGPKLKPMNNGAYGSSRPDARETVITSAASAASAAWQGFGTALKPASEHWILIRKPISEKTVAKNVLKWGCGGLNIDASRIRVDENDQNLRPNAKNHVGHGHTFAQNDLRSKDDLPDLGFHNSLGRFPANLVLSCADTCTEDAHDMFECPIAMLDEQSGALRARGNKTAKDHGGQYAASSYMFGGRESGWAGDTGGASRFFYCSKASKSDKNAGCEGLPVKKAGIGDDRPSGQSMQRLDGRAERAMQNVHPTVKSTKLMSYLIRMVTPPNGVVLDPFAGSGSTGVAALKEGFRFIGIEKEKEYKEIAEKRIEYSKTDSLKYSGDNW